MLITMKQQICFITVQALDTIKKVLKVSLSGSVGFWKIGTSIRITTIARTLLKKCLAYKLLLLVSIGTRVSNVLFKKKKKIFSVFLRYFVFLPPPAHNPKDPCASNTLSVLFEMCGLFRNATAASRNAMKLVPDQHADIVRFNFGRQLRKKGDYEDATEVYRQVKEVDFSIQCDFALSLFLGK